MAKGSNDNPARPRDNGASSSITTCHITCNTSTSNDPSGTCSGTVGSFNNYGEGPQKFDHATINSGSQNGTRSSCSGTIGSFNNRGRSQDFQHAKINSGCKTNANHHHHSTVTVESANHSSGSGTASSSLTARLARNLHIGNSPRKSSEQDPHCSGTLNSFNNLGNGDQSFNGAIINSGANSQDQ